MANVGKTGGVGWGFLSRRGVPSATCILQLTLLSAPDYYKYKVIMHIFIHFTTNSYLENAIVNQEQL